MTTSTGAGEAGRGCGDPDAAEMGLRWAGSHSNSYVKSNCVGGPLHLVVPRRGWCDSTVAWRESTVAGARPLRGKGGMPLAALLLYIMVRFVNRRPKTSLGAMRLVACRCSVAFRPGSTSRGSVGSPCVSFHAAAVAKYITRFYGSVIPRKVMFGAEGSPVVEGG